MTDLSAPYEDFKNNPQVKVALKKLEKTVKKYYMLYVDAADEWITDDITVELSSFIDIYFVKNYSPNNKFLTLEALFKNPDLMVDRVDEVVNELEHAVKVKNLTEGKTINYLFYDTVERLFINLVRGVEEHEEYLQKLLLPFLNCYFNYRNYDFTPEEYNLHKGFIKFFVKDKSYVTDARVYSALTMHSVDRIYYSYLINIFEETIEAEFYYYRFHKALYHYFSDNISLLEEYGRHFPNYEHFLYVLLFAESLNGEQSLNYMENSVQEFFDFNIFFNVYSENMPLEWCLELSTVELL